METQNDQLPKSTKREELHKRFAGELYLSDFNTGGPSRHNIKRIAAAASFDVQCLESANERRRQTYGRQ